MNPEMFERPKPSRTKEYWDSVVKDGKDLDLIVWEMRNNEHFFRPFAIDQDTLCGFVFGYCQGTKTRKELDDFFLANNDQNLVGQTFGEGDEKFKVTAVGPQAQQIIFGNLSKRTGVSWLDFK